MHALLRGTRGLHPIVYFDVDSPLQIAGIESGLHLHIVSIIKRERIASQAIAATLRKVEVHVALAQ